MPASPARDLIVGKLLNRCWAAKAIRDPGSPAYQQMHYRINELLDELEPHGLTP